MKPFLATVLFVAAGALPLQAAQLDPASPTPSPAASASPAPADSAASETLRKLEQEWADAVVHHDATAIARIEADDFIGTDPTGTLTNKAQDLEDAKSQSFDITSFKLDDIKVSVYGTAAVLTGQTVFAGTAGGQDIGGKYRWTDVFIQHDGKWQVVASQATSIAPPAVGTKPEE